MTVLLILKILSCNIVNDKTKDLRIYLSANQSNYSLL